MSEIITIQNLRFRWPSSTTDTLSINSLSIKAGEKVFIHGPSGTGKTTLLNLLSGVVEANSGLVSILGQEIKRLTPPARDHFRAQHIGYIFQAFNLIPYLTMTQNIALACHFSKAKRQRALTRSKSIELEILRLLNHLELDDKLLLNKPVSTLSIGQQQRVAAARALIGQPELIIADEPTSALDNERRQRFLELLFQEAESCGSTVVFVSHDTTLEKLFDRNVKLSELNQAQKVTQ